MNTHKQTYTHTGARDGPLQCPTPIGMLALSTAQPLKVIIIKNLPIAAVASNCCPQILVFSNCYSSCKLHQPILMHVYSIHNDKSAVYRYAYVAYDITAAIVLLYL